MRSDDQPLRPKPRSSDRFVAENLKGNLTLDLRTFTLAGLKVSQTKYSLARELHVGAILLFIFSLSAPALLTAQTPIHFQRQAGNLVLSWTNQPWSGLEFITNLSSTNWAAIATTPAVTNGQFVLTNTITGASRFFRLKDCDYAAPPIPVVTVAIQDDPTIYQLHFATAPSTPPDFTCTVEDSLVICSIPQSPVDASLGITFDASQSIDPRSCTNGSLDFHWQIFKPISQGGDLYAARGITGYRSSVLQIAPDSLPNLPDIEGDEFSTSWRVFLTLKHQPFDPGATPPHNKVVSFRFRYLGSRLSLEMSNTCQTQTNACPTCPCTITNGLPTLENF